MDYTKGVELLSRNDWRRFYWVCGDEPVLREDYVAQLSQRASFDVLGYVHVSAEKMPEKKIWALANAYSDGSAGRFIVVREAHRLTNSAFFVDWARSRRTPATVLVAVADKTPNADFMTAVKDIGRRKIGAVVDCSLPGDPARRGEKVVKVLQQWGKISPDVAVHLYNRTGGNLARCRDAMCWSGLFHTTMTRDLADRLISDSSDHQFISSLLSLDKKQAMAAAQKISHERYPGIIDVLSDEIVLAGRVNRASVHGESLYSLASKLGVSTYLVTRARAYAKHYDREAVSHRAEVLAVAWSAAQRGARTGVLEMVVASW